MSFFRVCFLSTFFVAHPTLSFHTCLKEVSPAATSSGIMADLSFRRVLWLLVWSLLWSLSRQQDDNYSFTNPPPDSSQITNPSYQVGSDIDIEWVGGNDFVSVRLVHVLPGENYDEFTYVFSMLVHDV